MPTQDVLGIAIHKLAFGYDENHIFKTLMASNERMWNAIEKGSVVVHCLAGMHRFVERIESVLWMCVLCVFFVYVLVFD